MSVRIIAIEGLEAAGKTTLFDSLRAELGAEAVFIEESALALSSIYPVGTSAPVEFEVALMAQDTLAMRTAQLALAEDRAVVMDRCWISGLVYATVRKQRFGDAFSFDPELHWLQARVFERLFPGVMERSTLFYLDASPQTCLDRWSARGEDGAPNGHRPDHAWLRLIGDTYERVLDRMRQSAFAMDVVRIDANGTREQIVERAVEAMRGRVPRRVTVATACIVHDGRVLLYPRRHAAMPEIDGLLDFPGGKVEEGESVAAAAVREAREETGLQIEIEELVPFAHHNVWNFPEGAMEAEVHCCVSRLRGDRSEVDARFGHEWKWIPLDDVPRHNALPGIGRFIDWVRTDLASYQTSSKRKD
jgi:8-oxo-dGTP pyrophosphatase MutT (NUDIX family)